MIVLKAAMVYSHVIDKSESGDASGSLNVSVC